MPLARLWNTPCGQFAAQQSGLAGGPVRHRQMQTGELSFGLSREGVEVVGMVVYGDGGHGGSQLLKHLLQLLIKVINLLANTLKLCIVRIRSISSSKKNISYALNGSNSFWDFRFDHLNS